MKLGIVYTVYGQNIENTLKLLQCNKNFSLIESRNDSRAKWYSITTTKINSTHNLFSDNYEQMIDNLNSVKIAPARVKRKDFMDRWSRLNAIKHMTESIIALKQLSTKYMQLKEYK